MYEVKILSDFSSSHCLRNYGGKCEQGHGHNWKIEVMYQSPTVDSVGLVIDFKIMKERVNRLLDTLDHINLNDIDYFRTHNPSSENIACYIYQQLKQDRELSSKAQLSRVNVWETDTSCASYYE